ncbi:MAG TPA: D-alanine--D-alanine ligase [Desulfonatronum sp.]|nr:D-alanine--D-alanine ligase [Desulfonatronum sp.]
MRIGMIYDLREQYLLQGFNLEQTAEFDSTATVEAIERGIRDMGLVPERIGNLFEAMPALGQGRRWDLVFNIAEGLYGLSRESQVPALLEAHRIPCTFSDALVLAVCLHKGVTKRIIRDLGLPTPDFAVIQDLAETEGLALSFPLFAKPVAEGTSKGISQASLIQDKNALERTCADLLARFQQPVLVERYLPGREFTVGVVGTGPKARCLGAMEVLLLENAEQDVYSLSNKEEYEDRVRYQLVDGVLSRKLAGLAVDLWRGLGARDAGRVDIRLDEHGRPQILEINPLPGLHPIRSDLSILCRFQGITHGELIRMIMESALERALTGHNAPYSPVASVHGTRHAAGLAA